MQVSKYFYEFVFRPHSGNPRRSYRRKTGQKWPFFMKNGDFLQANAKIAMKFVWET